MDRQGARQVRENHEGQEDEQEVVDALGQERGDVRSDREGLPAVGVLTEEASSEEDVRIVVGEGSDEVREALLAADLNTLTPIEAMNLLYKLQQKARG